MEHRYTNVANVLNELYRSEHEPRAYEERSAGTGALPACCLVRVLSYLRPRHVLRNCVVCRRWRALAVSPRLWQPVASCAAGRAGKREHEMASRHYDMMAGAQDEVAHFDAARRALQVVPTNVFRALRDPLAMAARRSAAPPPLDECAVLDACCAVVGRPKGTPSAYRAALDGDAVKRRTDDEPLKAEKLVAALRNFEIEAATQSPLERRRLKSLIANVRASEAFASPTALGRRNLLLGRLATWCGTAALLATALMSAEAFAEEASDDYEVEEDRDLMRCAEYAAQRWIALCAAPVQRKLAGPRPRPVPARRSSTSNARVQAPPKAATPKAASRRPEPPPSPMLYSIYRKDRRREDEEIIPADVKKGPARDCSETLRRFYLKHNPALAPQAAAIAREWRGAESTLFSLLKYKYRHAKTTSPELTRALHKAETTTTTKKPSVPRQKGAAAPTVPAKAQTPPPRGEAIKGLRQEIDRLKTVAARDSARASAAATEAAKVREELHTEDEAHRRQLEARDEELASLRRELDRLADLEEQSASSMSGEHFHPPGSSSSSDFGIDDHTPLSFDDDHHVVGVVEGELDVASAAVEAVLSAIVDYSLTECAIEIDFELEFGFDEEPPPPPGSPPQDYEPPPPPTSPPPPPRAPPPTEEEEEQQAPAASPPPPTAEEAPAASSSSQPPAAASSSSSEEVPTPPPIEEEQAPAASSSSSEVVHEEEEEAEEPDDDAGGLLLLSRSERPQRRESPKRVMPLVPLDDVHNATPPLVSCKAAAAPS